MNETMKFIYKSAKRKINKIPKEIKDLEFKLASEKTLIELGLEDKKEISDMGEQIRKLENDLKTAYLEINPTPAFTIKEIEEMDKEIEQEDKEMQEKISLIERKEKDFKGIQYGSEEYKTIIPVEYLSFPMFPQNGLHLMAGTTGALKSTFSLYVALCFATGKEILGMKVKKPFKVVYIDVENGEDLIQEWIDGWIKGENFNKKLVNENFKFHTIRTLNISIKDNSLDADWRKVVKMVTDFNANIIFLDSFTAAIDTNLSITGNINDLYKFLCKEFLDKNIAIYGVSEMNKFSSTKPDKNKMLNDMKGNATLGHKMTSGVGIIKQKRKIGEPKNIVHLWYVPTKIRRGEDGDILDLEIVYETIKNEEKEMIDKLNLRVVSQVEEFVKKDASAKCSDWILNYLKVNSLKEFKTGTKNEESLRIICNKNTAFKSDTFTKAIRLLKEEKKIKEKEDGVKGLYTLNESN